MRGKKIIARSAAHVGPCDRLCGVLCTLYFRFYYYFFFSTTRFPGNPWQRVTILRPGRNLNAPCRTRGLASLADVRCGSKKKKKIINNVRRTNIGGNGGRRARSRPRKWVTKIILEKKNKYAQRGRSRDGDHDRCFCVWISDSAR